jgi:hypothetical protein
MIGFVNRGILFFIVQLFTSVPLCLCWILGMVCDGDRNSVSILLVQSDQRSGG